MCRSRVASDFHIYMERFVHIYMDVYTLSFKFGVTDIQGKQGVGRQSRVRADSARKAPAAYNLQATSACSYRCGAAGK